MKIKHIIDTSEEEALERYINEKQSIYNEMQQIHMSGIFYTLTATIKTMNDEKKSFTLLIWYTVIVISLILILVLI